MRRSYPVNKYIFKTTSELIGRLERAQSAGTPKGAVATELKQLAGTMQPASRRGRASPAAINQAAGRRLIEGTAAQLDAKSLDDVLSGLHASEHAIASSKPAL